MKRPLLGTAALIALMTGPASAGPALDALVGLMLEGAEVRHTAERVEGGEEVYEGLEISAGGDLVRLEGARLTLTEGAVGLIGDRVRFTRAEGGGGEIGRIDLSVPLAIRGLPAGTLLAGENGVRVSPELCGALRTPIRVAGSDVTFGSGGRIASLRLDAVVSGPDEACLLDLTQELTGAELTDPAGLGLRVAEQRVRLRTPVTPGLPEVATGETWSSTFSLSGAELLMNGTVELRLGRLETGLRLDGDSLLPLAATGHARALAKAIAAGRAPEEQLPWADLWNGLRAAVGEGLVSLKGVEVTGTGLAALTGVTGPLDPGARIDLSGVARKSEEGLTGSLTLDGTATALLAVEFGVATGPADPSFNTLPPGALLTGAPISLTGASVRFSDRGVGQLLERVLGMSPYEVLNAALPGWLGAEKGALVAAWADRARDGGTAAFRAAPAEPVPLLTIGMMGLGDWTVLGQMLNVSTGAE